MFAVRTERLSTGGERFRLGATLVVDPVRNVILRDGQAGPVEPRVMQLLLYLGDRAGEIVSKRELMAEVWQANVVDEAVQRAVSLLRSALGESGQEPRIIETVPGRGYRLLVAPAPEQPQRRVLLAACIALAALALAFLLLAFRPDAPQPVVQPAVPATVPNQASAEPQQAPERIARSATPQTLPEARVPAHLTTPAPEAIAPPAPTPQAAPPRAATPAPDAEPAPLAPGTQPGG